jgi:hypothetical protein
MEYLIKELTLTVEIISTLPPQAAPLDALECFRHQLGVPFLWK